MTREHGLYKIVDKPKRSTELTLDEPLAQDLNLRDQKRLHEHSPVSDKRKVGNRVILPPELIREGNKIIEQLYVDEIINAIDEVLGLTSDKLAALGLIEL